MSKNSKYTNSLLEHLFVIFKATQEKAKKQNKEYYLWEDFKKWSLNTNEYKQFYETWKESNFYYWAVPFIVQIDYKKGFILENLQWSNSGYTKENIDYDKKCNQEKWDYVDANPRLKIYYSWNGALSKYGLTRKSWNKLVLQSNGHCMLMGEQFKNASNDCHIDHDHVTNKVRGLLCARCNHLLAGLDNLKFRKKALKYLKKIFIQD